MTIIYIVTGLVLFTNLLYTIYIAKHVRILKKDHAADRKKLGNKIKTLSIKERKARRKK